jgi:Zn-dependent protease with chaperone function
LFFIWMTEPSDSSARVGWADLLLFFSFYVFLVVMLGLWSRLLARRVAADNFHRSVRRFNKVMFAARLMVPVWFAIGVWALGWGALIGALGGTFYRSAAGLLLGTLPPFATWMGLWWSQYPAERALREQNLLVELDNDLPLYRPPGFRSYFFSNFRLQILFTLVPVAMIVLVRDAITWGTLWWLGKPLTSDSSNVLEFIASLTAAGGVFVFAPVILARVLNTSPMPDSPLRQRLDAMCQRAGIRYRHILIWNTNNHVGNAAVMGILPWIRYVLLSDVLLERMSDEEIEAVFAHELGHVVHRHMTWYGVFFLVGMLGTVIAACVPDAKHPYLDANLMPAMAPGAIVAMFLLFGALSRRCERQADVYAARTMELLKAQEPVTSESLYSHRQVATVGATPVVEMPSPKRTPVGEHGAWQFAAALRRVAIINNIPINPRVKPDPGLWNHVTHYADALVEMANNFLHGSIASRMEYVQDLATDPRRTGHFDRTMFWLYCTLLFTFFISAVCSVFLLMGQPPS